MQVFFLLQRWKLKSLKKIIKNFAPMEKLAFFAKESIVIHAPKIIYARVMGFAQKQCSSQIFLVLSALIVIFQIVCSVTQTMFAKNAQEI